MSNPTLNRPFNFLERDRRGYITYKSEHSIRCDNDDFGNSVYIGRAKPGTSEDDEKWQISYHTYDANNSLTSKLWAQDADGNASTDYQFSWTDRATYTYS